MKGKKRLPGSSLNYGMLKLMNFATPQISRVYLNKWSFVQFGNASGSMWEANRINLSEAEIFSFNF